MQRKHCPVCQTPVSETKIVGNSVFCRCGWTGSLSEKRKKRGSAIAKTLLTLTSFTAIVLGILMSYFWWNYRPYSLEYVRLKVLTTIAGGQAENYRNLGLLCNTLAEPNCAVDAFSEILRLEPDNRYATGNVAINLYELGSYSQAAQMFERYFDLGGSGVDAFSHYGFTLEKLGQLNEAEKWYLKALVVEPRLVDVAGRLIDLYVQRKDFDGALDLIERLKRASPKSGEYFKSKALIIEDLKEKASRSNI